jgi:biopolymer transport protein ExbB
MGIWEISIFQLIKSGGPIMVPIILCSIFALGIVIEKIYYFSKLNTNTHLLKEQLFEYIKANKIQDAIHFCDSINSPVARVLKAGVGKFGSSRDEIKEAMEDCSLFEIPKLEKRMTALATIAHITPLLGLLGTVTGMTGSFHTIQVRSSTLNPVTPGDLAGGIWEALLTTVAGLVVAIPTFVAYNYLTSRINFFILEMERAATELVNFMSNINQSSLT